MSKTIIHVRFAPDGSVFEIGERPTNLSTQQWFTKLSARAGSAFESLSGGRGVFRLTGEEIAALKASTLQ
jgi:hypothetical protein